MSKKTILFDFDGVIADSFKYCYKTNTFPAGTTEQDYRDMFNGNFYDAHKERVAEKDRKAYQELYWKRFLEGIDEVLLVSNIKNILKKLAMKYRLAIVSSATSQVIEKIMKREGIEKYFIKTFGADLHESKVAKFRIIFDEFEVRPTDCLFVTDTLGDLLEAEKAGIESIAVSWGFHDAETLKKGKFMAIIHRPEELPNEIERYFA